MLEDRYRELIKMFDAVDAGGPFSLEEMMGKATEFFEELRREFVAAPVEDKQEIAKMVNRLQNRLREVTKKAAERAKMTEEEFTALGNDPRYVSKEDRACIEKTERQMYATAKDFSDALQQKKSVSESQKKSTKKSEPGIRSKVKRAKKKDWLKS